MKRWMICACFSLILLTACSASQESGDSTESAPVTASASLQTTSDTSQTNETTQPVSGRPEQSSGTSLPQTGETLADFEVVLGKNKRIPFTAISQYPELPTGCEVTSLAMVFNYYNVYWGLLDCFIQIKKQIVSRYRRWIMLCLCSHPIRRLC